MRTHTLSLFHTHTHTHAHAHAHTHTHTQLRTLRSSYVERLAYCKALFRVLRNPCCVARNGHDAFEHSHSDAAAEDTDARCSTKLYSRMETWVGWGGERAARDMAKSSREQGDKLDLEGRPSLALSSVLRSDGVPITPPLSSATAAVAAAKARSYRTTTTTGGLSEPLLLLSNKSGCEPLTEPNPGNGEFYFIFRLII